MRAGYSPFSGQRPLQRGNRLRACGFSLVEVVMALGITSFAILALMALLPVGLQSAKESQEETQVSNLLAGLTADRRATPFSSPSLRYQLPALTNAVTTSAFFGITESGDYVGANLSQARYRVDYRLLPPAAKGLDPYQLHFQVSWPAAATNLQNSVEWIVAYPQP
jgi:type II secretory pathway pseudopilin PulG